MKRQKLIDKRLAKHSTQREVAEAVGISMQHYSKIELGHRMPSYEIMVRLANYFNVKPDYLFYDESLLKVENEDKILQ